MFEVDTDCYYKGSPVRIVHNEDGYIVARRPNGAEVEPVNVKDLSMQKPVQASAQILIHEKQWEKAYKHLEKAEPLSIDAAKLEYRLLAQSLDLKVLPWNALPYKERMAVIAQTKSMTPEFLYKEYR